ncbi:MAG TPA: CBS domain-containing protein [Azospirillum sp.]
MMHRNVGDLLTNRRVVHLPPSATVREAACQMKASHVASVVVTDHGDDHLEGIFTERDLTERVVAAGLDPERTPLSAVMTPCPITVDLDTTVRDAMRHMFCNGLRHLPIVRGDKVVGIVSMRDFMGEELALLDREKELMESLTEVI